MTMAANALANLCSTTDPAELEQLFGPPAVLTGEEAKRYRQILRAFAQVAKPRDIIEWIYLSDLAYYRTEIQRLQRVMPALIQNAHKAYLERRAIPLALDIGDKQYRVREGLDDELKAEMKNLKCKPEEVDAQIEALKAVRIEKIQSEYQKAMQKLTEEHAADVDCAASFRAWSDDYERANRCLEFAQKQYDQTRSRLEQYRSGFGELLRRANDTVIEGEFQEDIVDERQTAAPELPSAPTVPVDDEMAAAATNLNGRAGAAPATVTALPDSAAPTEDSADSQHR